MVLGFGAEYSVWGLGSPGEGVYNVQLMCFVFFHKGSVAIRVRGFIWGVSVLWFLG